MKVLVVGTLQEMGVELLEEAGVEVEFLAPTEWRSEEAVMRESRDADAIIVGRVPITRKIIKNANKLRIIARHGVGVENIDVGAATECGIPVTDVGESNSQAVAEHTICLMMILAKQALRADRIIRAGKWVMEFSEGFSRSLVEIAGKTLGVVGFGRIGRRVTSMAQAFSMRVLVYDPYILPNKVKEFGAEPVDSLEELLRESDFVTLHVPLIKETFHLIGEEELNLMKGTAFLINTCRGGVINEHALIKGLVEKKIGGAGLDVLEKAPPNSDNPMRKMDNVVLTPHVGWFTEEAFRRMGIAVARDVIKALRNETPQNVLNRAVLRLEKS